MNGDDREALFQRWLRDHMGLLLKVARNCIENSADRDDLFQDILLNLWLSVPKYRGDSKESTWIYRVAFNTAICWKRGEKRRQLKLNTYFQINDCSRLNLTTTDSDVIENLYAAIHKLSIVDASIAIMHLDGLSYQEMSDVLGISSNHIGVKLTRIRKQLALNLEGIKDEF